MPEETAVSQKSKTNKKGIASFVVFFVLVLGVGGLGFKYYQAQEEIKRLSTPDGQQMLAQKEADTVIAQVAKHMLLPEGERPTIATVTDPETLKPNQPFFEKAEAGDRVLVYAQEKKAILYNPKKDIVVNVGFISMSENTQGVTQSPEQPVVASVEVRNGTETTGLGQKVSDSIKNTGAYAVSQVADAGKKGYEKTLVVDFGKLSDKHKASALAEALGNAEVVTVLPEGEAQSNADLLVIVGQE